VRTSAARAVFIDDIAENVQAARSLGMHGIQYGNADQLRSDLRTLDPELGL
jgi:2-haloacid dehalogenase